MISFEQLLEKASKLEPFFIETRRFFHRNPELSWKEYRTSAYLRVLLEQNGLHPSEPMAGGTGFYVDFGPAETPKTAWRADIDALPIFDKKTTSYSSAADGIGHLCGHDVHCTIALGIALVLKDQELKKGIRVFFQPAEESSPSGAPKMIEDGVLVGVDRVFGLHCDPNQESGFVSINSGPETASYDGIHVTLSHSATNHSARPHTGKDLIWISTLLLQEWYAIAGRITDSRDPSILTICTFHAGEAINVMPNEVELSGTLRSVSENSRVTLKTFMLESCKNLELLHGISIDLRFDDGSPAVLNNGVLAAQAKTILADYFKIQATRQSMGAEDFAWYTYQVPSLFIRVGTRKNEATAFALHHNCFDVDETIIAPTIAKMAYLLTKID